MLRKLGIIFLILAAGSVAFAADHSSNVSIMTQNMDDGTDQTYIVAAALNLAPLTIADAVDLTFAELQASHLPARAAALARQIALRKPDILALQEASLWRVGTTRTTANTVLYDQLAGLLSALNNLGVPYNIAAVNAVSDVALEGNQVPALRFTDRDALLVRADLGPPTLHLSDVHSRVFDAALPFPPLGTGIEVKAGWIAANVHTGNKQFRLLATHLISPIPTVSEATLVQMAQAQELLREVRNSPKPVVLCGDFNSDALQGGGPDTTPTALLIQAAGYAEVWSLLHTTPGDTGPTWPLYLEDQFPPAPFFALFAPFERIDLFFAKDIDAVSIDRVFSPMPAAVPPFGSDHAGVIAVFQP